jgi:hypothetical protein
VCPEVIVELIRSAFDFLKDTFDRIALTDGFVSQIEAKSVESGVKPGSAVDEKHGGLDVMFHREFAQEEFDHRSIPLGIEASVEDSAGGRDDRADQPECSPSIFTTVSSSATFLGEQPLRGLRSAFCTQLWIVEHALETPNRSSTMTVLDSDRPPRWSSIAYSINGTGVWIASTKSDSTAILPSLRRAVLCMETRNFPPQFPQVFRSSNV